MVILGLWLILTLFHGVFSASGWVLPRETELFVTLYPDRYYVEPLPLYPGAPTPAADPWFIYPAGRPLFAPLVKDFNPMGVNDLKVAQIYGGSILWGFHSWQAYDYPPHTHGSWSYSLVATQWRNGTLDQISFNLPREREIFGRGLETLAHVTGIVISERGFRPPSIGPSLPEIAIIGRHYKLAGTTYACLVMLIDPYLNPSYRYIPYYDTLYGRLFNYAPYAIISELDYNRQHICKGIFDGVAVDLDGDGFDELVVVGSVTAPPYSSLSEEPWVGILRFNTTREDPSTGIEVLNGAVIDFTSTTPPCVYGTNTWAGFITVDLVYQDSGKARFIATGICSRAGGLPSIYQVVVAYFEIDSSLGITVLDEEVYQVDTMGDMPPGFNIDQVTDSVVYSYGGPETVYVTVAVRQNHTRSAPWLPVTNVGGALLRIDGDPAVGLSITQLQYLPDVEARALALVPGSSWDAVVVVGAKENSTVPNMSFPGILGEMLRSVENVIVVMNPDGSSPRYYPLEIYPDNPHLRSVSETLGLYEVAIDDVDQDGELEVIVAGLIHRKDMRNPRNLVRIEMNVAEGHIIPFIAILGEKPHLTTTQTLTRTSTKTIKITTTRTPRTTATITQYITRTDIVMETITKTSFKSLVKSSTKWVTLHETRTYTTTSTNLLNVTERVKVVERVKTTVTFTTTRTNLVNVTTAGLVMVPEPPPTAPGILEKPPWEVLWILPGLLLGLLLPLPIIFRRKPLVTIVFSEPSRLHDKAREIASNLMWLTDDQHLKLDTKLKPSNKKGLLEAYVKGRKIYSTKKGEEADPLEIATRIAKAITGEKVDRAGFEPATSRVQGGRSPS